MPSSVTIVLPSIVPAYTLECLATLHPDILDVAAIPGPPTGHQRDPLVVGVNGRTWTDGQPDVRLIVAWNTPEHNLGCSGTWNLGIDDVLEHERDWLWILSAGVRFGSQGGRDFLRWLDEFAAVRPDVLGVEAGRDLGWHCIAIPRHVLEKVGRFDAALFTPAYFEDNDWSVRVQRAYDLDTKAPGFTGPLWPKVEIGARLPEVAHGITRSSVSVNFAELERRFHEKWGPNEEYRTPYADPTLDWTHVGGPKVAV